PGIAFDGTNYTGAWVEGTGGFGGNRVTAAGALLNGAAGVPLTGSTGVFGGDVGVFAAGSATYITWDAIGSSAASFNVFGSRLSTGLALLDPPGGLASGSGHGQAQVDHAAGGERRGVTGGAGDRKHGD